MNREFVDLYNQELALFYEHAQEFALEYPGIAERLGGMAKERSDPMFAALLQGAAFLAARVQLKIRDEFPEFTSNLIEQLLPGFLAPIPAVMLVRVEPLFGDPALREGRTIRRGALLDAVYRERDKNVSCCFTLSSDLSIWPFELVEANYFASPGPLQALGVQGDFAAGLRLSLQVRTVSGPDGEPPPKAARENPTALFAGCHVAGLPFHFIGDEGDAASLYEQVFARRVGLHVRYLDEFDNPRFVDTGDIEIEEVGLTEDESLFPHNPRLFSGFSLLQEYFVFPRKFLGFRLRTSQRELFPVPARDLDLILTFSEASPRLATAIDKRMFALYAAPAVNLFEKTADRVPIDTTRHEYQVVPDRSHPFDFEPHTVLEVFAHRAGQARRERLSPLYAVSTEAAHDQSSLHYTVRRLPRRRTSAEQRFGSPSDYVGTEMFLSMSVPEANPDVAPVDELSVRALCTNRHLPERLPVGTAGADFTFAQDTSLRVLCVSGPTRPRSPLLHQKDNAGATAWQLVNALSLNHTGLARPDGDAQALREILTLFANLNEPAIERRIRSLRSVKTTDVVRRVSSRFGIGVARGLKVSLTFEEKSFEGSGVFLFGAVLERFLAEYAALNHFTQTALETVERGHVAQWPPRAGSRRPL